MTRPDPGDLVARVLERVGSQAEATVRATRAQTGLTRFTNSAIHQNVAEESTATSLTVAVGGRVATVATTRHDGEGLARLVDSALEAARLRPVDRRWAGLAPPSPRPDVEHWDRATAGAGPAARAGVVASFIEAGSNRAGAGPLVAAGYCETSSSLVALANSAGQRVGGRATAATVDGIFRLTAAGTTSDGAASATGAGLWGIDGGALGTAAAGTSRRASQPRPLEPGDYEVVLSPACVAHVMDFLSMGFNAKAYAEGRSHVRLGETQMDPAITIDDDATDPRALGLVFDAEGTPKAPVALVAGGSSVGLVHDRRTAAAAGTASTGHAVAGGERYGPAATNLFLHGGPARTADLVSAMTRGLYVCDFWYTRILDPKTQVVTGLTRNGVFLVEGGEIVAPVANLRFTQSFLAALGPGRVLAVGDDARLVGGWCHVPSLHLASWAFTGGPSG